MISVSVPSSLSAFSSVLSVSQSLNQPRQSSQFLASSFSYSFNLSASHSLFQIFTRCLNFLIVISASHRFHELLNSVSRLLYFVLQISRQFPQFLIGPMSFSIQLAGFSSVLQISRQFLIRCLSFLFVVSASSTDSVYLQLSKIFIRYFSFPSIF